AQQRINAYPYEMSGGMRQRAMIAMALCCYPAMLIADEPTTALDVTIQAQILDLMISLQKEIGMSIMLITHDLGVIAETADNVAVMYLGKIVEEASVNGIFNNPGHPYTQALLDSIPRVEENKEEWLTTIKGFVPDLYNIPTGCAFHPRCSKYMDGICNKKSPHRIEIEEGHTVSCLLHSKDLK
ncbi:MAG: ABC transporter ATP-binding protein, partial [Chitinispirillia bacterium]